MKKLLELANQYKMLISYCFFGAVTTAVNLLVYYVCTEMLGIPSDPSVVIAWVLAVLVAFFTNKPFVFYSHNWSAKVLLPEMAEFFGCRIGTGLLELILMHILVVRLLLPSMWMKLLVNILVIILNYVGSKLWVFRKKGQ